MQSYACLKTSEWHENGASLKLKIHQYKHTKTIMKVDETSSMIQQF